MVNVVNAVKGATLNYGSRMESDQVLKNWMVKMNWTAETASITDGGQFLIISPGHLALTLNVVIPSTAPSNFEVFIKGLQKNDLPQEFSSKMWINKSNQLAMVAKLMSQPENQRLLGLALASNSGVPLRYGVQHEVAPGIKYWTYHADQLDLPSHSKNNLETVAVIVSSSNPVLAVCRTVAPLLAASKNVILVPENGSIALPCTILADLINQAGLNCTVYQATPTQWVELVSVEGVEWIMCGTLSQSLQLRNTAKNLKLDLDGKKAFVVAETGDCDAAVDAALVSLKASGSNSPGLYMIVQDSLLEDVTWRLKDRFKNGRSGDVLDAFVDFASCPRFQAPKAVSDFLQNTPLDVVEVGNSRVVINAQPSLPPVQWDRLGQTLMVMSYRSIPEAITLLNNLSGVIELSLWVDHQAAAWQLINQVQVARVWVNGSATYEPGFDQLTRIQHVASSLPTLPDGKTNAGLYAAMDSLRAAQRSWAGQPAGQKRQLLTKLLKQLLEQDSFQSSQNELLELVKAVHCLRETLADSCPAKGGMVFELTAPLGLVAVSDSGEKTDRLVRLVVLTLLKGNAVFLSSNDPRALDFIKIAKEAGLPVASCPQNDENSRALVKHHGLRLLVLLGQKTALPLTEGEPHSVNVWQWPDEQEEDDEEIIRQLTIRKRVWVAVGDGLAN